MTLILILQLPSLLAKRTKRRRRKRKKIREASHRVPIHPRQRKRMRRIEAVAGIRRKAAIAAKIKRTKVVIVAVVTRRKAGLEIGTAIEAATAIVTGRIRVG